VRFAPAIAIPAFREGWSAAGVVLVRSQRPLLTATAPAAWHAEWYCAILRCVRWICALRPRDRDSRTPHRLGNSKCGSCAKPATTTNSNGSCGLACGAVLRHFAARQVDSGVRACDRVSRIPHSLVRSLSGSCAKPATTANGSGSCGRACGTVLRLSATGTLFPGRFRS
jgi:hypothetical protein